MKSESIIISLLIGTLFFTNCSSGEQRVKQVTGKETDRRTTRPILNVYNMGGVPLNEMDEFVGKLKTIYPETRYAGKLALVDSACIKNDPMGKNRYWWPKLCSHLVKTTDTKNGITLVLVNAEVCNRNNKNGSHANLGVSNLGGHVSTVSYQRLRVNRLDNLNDMTKVAIHELGHSVAALVRVREDLRYHCSIDTCLMRDAKNHYPYRGVISFCPRCARAMKAKGFKVDALMLSK